MKWGQWTVYFLTVNALPAFTDYLDSGKKLPKKGEIIIIYGSKGDDVVFVDKLFPLKDKIYMKLSELK